MNANMVLIDKSGLENITTVSKSLVDRVQKFLICLPESKNFGQTKVKYLLLKENYEKIERIAQDLLRDTSLAGDTFSLLSAIQTKDHKAIYFEVEDEGLKC